MRKAKDWLDEKGISYEKRNIVKENPAAAEIKALHEKSGLDIKKFINTNGKAYKETGLKDKLPEMSLTEIYDFLSTDGLLVKRPILTNGEIVLPGFKEKDWEKVLAI